MACFLGIDIGGTVTKAGLYSAEGEEIGVAERYADVLSPSAGFTERDMDELWRTVCAVIREVIQTGRVKSADILGVSFSAHGKGLYAIDAQGRPVRNGIISSDTRALTLVRHWREQGIDRLTYPRGLQQLWTAHPATLLRWLKIHEPENYQRISSVLMAHDYVRYCLTGVIAAEVTNISGSNLYNQYNGNYDPQLMADFGIADARYKTAPVIGSTQQAGRVTESAAQACGLAAGTPVYGGLFDVVASAVCSGVCDDRILSAVAGTWSIATSVTDAIIPATYPYVWGSYCVPGKFFVHEGSPTSAANLSWFMRNFCSDETDPYARFDQWVAERGGQSTEMIFLPYLFGSNYSLNLAGGLVGMRSHHNKADIVHALYQGIVFSHLVHQDRILKLNPKIARIRITGGPTHSAVWMQMFADAGNLPLDVVDIQQSGCRAAALCAAVGQGYYADFAQAIAATQPYVRTYLPQKDAHFRLRRQMARFLDTAKALSEVAYAE
ncbi:FGGY-family carbohydrate kinase [Martelella alba]|uniref:Carbohydrate kinase n=1 Tax=Martelella alba TaxID=2590451 RepID=A0ABY2SJA8_9HYPH|nr:FGGY-family carbohydrate kinase [Martelella alba]TKI04977.1 carbohydrate kinase [Martelella alba]